MNLSIKSSGFSSLILIFLPFVFFYNSPGISSAVYTCIYQMLLIFAKSTLYGHLSAGDEIWSTAPIIYAYLLSPWNTKATAQFLLITLWGLRLSYNLWRKGGYRGLEDYRWVEVKKRFTNPISWRLFHVLFLCIYQMIINFQLVIPIYYSENGDLQTFDYICIVFGVGFIVLQLLADQQQWDFQCKKKAGGKKENEIGFIRTGLWRYSRHPNYFAELGLWWSIYMLSSGANLGVLGVLTMTGLFQRVIRLTEKISASKYPLYKEYQQQTSKLIPWGSTNKHII